MTYINQTEEMVEGTITDCAATIGPSLAKLLERIDMSLR